MSAFNAAPCQGHLDTVYHSFLYLKQSGAHCILFDDYVSEFEIDFCNSESWKEFYKIDKEPTPSNMPELCGNSVIMSCWVDTSHASNKVTVRIHTGIFIES